MSLPPSSLSSLAPAPGNSTSSVASARGDESSRGDSESFGDVLSRSLAASGEGAAKPGGKPAPSPPAKRLADEKKNEPPEAINTAALLFVPLEMRTAKASIGDGGVAATGVVVTSALTSSPAAEVPANPDNATPSGAAAIATTASDGPLTADSETQAPPTALASGLPVAPAKGKDVSALAAPSTTGGDAALSQPAANTALPVSAPHSSREEQGPGREHRGGDEAREALGTDTRVDSKSAAAKTFATAAANDTHDETAVNATQMSALAGAGQGTDTATPATPQGFNLGATPSSIHANAATPNPAAAPAPHQAALTPEVGSGEWGKALGRQMLHMGKAGEQVAELQLNPPGLGPLKVTLSLNDNQVQAFFVSAHASVRASVEAALPQLRGTLADNGISLGNTSVDSGSQQQQQAFAFSQGQDSRSSSEERRQPGRQGYLPADAPAHSPAAATSTAPRGKVDTYA